MDERVAFGGASIIVRGSLSCEDCTKLDFVNKTAVSYSEEILAEHVVTYMPFLLMFAHIVHQLRALIK